MTVRREHRARDAPTPSELVGELAGRATGRGLRLCTAESCTGGLLGAAITGVAGASAYYRGGLVAYSNQVKINDLGVDPEVLEREGAVSREVALQMAAGACRRFSADLSMAVTGIAGPGGGTKAKPVGTVWLAVAGPGEGVRARLRTFAGDRDEVRRGSVAAVLGMAVEALTEQGASGQGRPGSGQRESRQWTRRKTRSTAWPMQERGKAK